MLEKILYYISIPFLLMLMLGFSFVDKVSAAEIKEYYYSNETPAGGVCVYDSNGNYKCRGGSSYSYYSTAFDGYNTDVMRFLAYSSSKPYTYIYYASLVQFMETNFSLPWPNETDTFTFTFYAKEDLSLYPDSYAFITDDLGFFTENYGSIFKDLEKINGSIYSSDDIYVQFAELTCDVVSANVYGCSYSVDLNLNNLSFSSLATGLFDSRGYEYTSVAFSRKINAIEKETIIIPTPTPGTMDETNEKLDNIENSITDETAPDLGGLSDSSGWLPAGPVDSIINLPLTFFNSLTSSLVKTCTPVELPLPFIDKNIELPCVVSLYEKMGPFMTLFNSFGVIASAFILYNYLLSLYKWVDDTLTFRENTWQDWGGV